jgi:hypothetical protein
MPPTPGRWRDGQMALRWVAAGMGEAAKQFRRVNGFLHLPALRRAGADCRRGCLTRRLQQRGRCLITLGPPPKFHGTQDILVSETSWYESV